MDYKAVLKSLVDQHLGGELDFEQFSEQYGKKFIDEMPDSALSAGELEAFGAIHEKVELTSRNPDAEDRKHGWVDLDQFRAWLRERRTQLDS